MPININAVKNIGNSADKLRHPRSVAYLVELVLLNKCHISGGGACLHCYQNVNATCEIILHQ